MPVKTSLNLQPVVPHAGTRRQLPMKTLSSEDTDLTPDLRKDGRMHIRNERARPSISGLVDIEEILSASQQRPAKCQLLIRALTRRGLSQNGNPILTFGGLFQGASNYAVPMGACNVQPPTALPLTPSSTSQRRNGRAETHWPTTKWRFPSSSLTASSPLFSGSQPSWSLSSSR